MTAKGGVTGKSSKLARPLGRPRDFGLGVFIPLFSHGWIMEYIQRRFDASKPGITLICIYFRINRKHFGTIYQKPASRRCSRIGDGVKVGARGIEPPTCPMYIGPLCLSIGARGGGISLAPRQTRGSLKPCGSNTSTTGKLPFSRPLSRSIPHKNSKIPNIRDF